MGYLRLHSPQLCVENVQHRFSKRMIKCYSKTILFRKFRFCKIFGFLTTSITDSLCLNGRNLLLPSKFSFHSAKPPSTKKITNWFFIKQDTIFAMHIYCFHRFFQYDVQQYHITFDTRKYLLVLTCYTHLFMLSYKMPLN